MLVTAQSVGKIFSTGGITTFLGLGMTFIVLTLLIFIIIGIDYLIKKISKLNLNKKTEPKVAVTANEELPTDDVGSATPIDESTQQAILQAVKMFSQYDDKDKKPHNNIKIKSIVEL